MTRGYDEPFLEGNVVRAIRARASESLTCLQRYAGNMYDEAALCCYLEGACVAAKRDCFKAHPELKKGIELRCENRAEAEYLAR